MDLVSGSDHALSELIRNLQESISRLKEYEGDDGFEIEEEVVQNLKSEIDRKFTECYNHLRRFKIRATQAVDRAAAKKKYNQRKKQVDEMKADYDEWHNKQMLYSQPKAINSKLKSSLDSQTRKLQEGKNELDNTRRLIRDAQDSANRTKEELEHQDDVIRHANKNVTKTREELTGAGRILGRLFKRNVAQRAIVMAMLLAGGLIIILTLIACVATPDVSLTTSTTTRAPNPGLNTGSTSQTTTSSTGVISSASTSSYNIDNPLLRTTVQGTHSAE